MSDLRTSPDHPYLDSCTLYLLGGLDPAAEREFENHLGTCPLCLDECERLGPAASGFAEIPADDLILLDLEPGPAPEPPVTAAVQAAPQRHTPRPGRAGRRRRLAMAALAGVAAVSFGAAALLAPVGDDAVTTGSGTVGTDQGTGAGSGALGSAPDAPVGPGEGGSRTIDPRNAAAATAEGTGGSASLSVTVRTAEDRSAGLRVEATVVGLREGEVYRLYAVTTGGASEQVAEWTAESGTREVRGEVSAGLVQLAFFSVTQRDGTAVVSAPLAR